MFVFLAGTSAGLMVTRKSPSELGRFLFLRGLRLAGPLHFIMLYPLLPWLGVMLLGFGAAALFEREAAARNRSLFLSMTLGPAAILCAFAARMRGSLKNIFVMFGRVPFAFYVAHFYLLHLLSVLMGVLEGWRRAVHDLSTVLSTGYGVLLYPFCAWVAGVKARSRTWWLSYV